LKNIGAAHLIKFYGGEDMKYPEIPRLKYMVLPKYGTKYQKVEPNTNLSSFTMIVKYQMVL